MILTLLRIDVIDTMLAIGGNYQNFDANDSIDDKKIDIEFYQIRLEYHPNLKSYVSTECLCLDLKASNWNLQCAEPSCLTLSFPLTLRLPEK